MSATYRRLESVVIVAMLGLSSTVACSRAAGVKAKLTFKQANQAYEQRDYSKAAGLYEQTVQADPNKVQVYFFLGNSYDNLYTPAAKGQRANDELLTKAVQNYTVAADRLSTTDPVEAPLKRLALQYLAAAYDADKLDDPVKKEPVVQRLIQLDPGDTTGYFVLAKLYEDAGAYDKAEQVLLRAKEAKPTDPMVYMQLAGYYKRQGRFEKSIEAIEERAQKEPGNPEAFYMIATKYWDQAYRGAGLKEADRKIYAQKGIAAVDHALQIKPDYVEALVYKDLLLRVQANLEKDPAKQQALIKQADTLRDKAQELRKRKATGVGD